MAPMTDKPTAINMPRTINLLSPSITRLRLKLLKFCMPCMMPLLIGRSDEKIMMRKTINSGFMSVCRKSAILPIKMK